MPMPNSGITASGCKSDVPTPSSVDLINFWKQLQELRKLVYSLDYWVITKNTNGYESIARWSDTWGEVLNTGTRSLGPSRAVCRCILIHQPGSSGNLSFGFGWWLHYIGMVDWPLVIELNLQRFSPPRKSGVGEFGGAKSSNNLIIWLVPLATRPYP